MRAIAHIILVAMLSTAHDARSQRAQDWITLGDKALADKDPYGALRYYEKAMLLDSAKALHNYKYAEALRYNHQYEKAAYYYYKVYRRDRGKVYPEGPAMLAMMQKQAGEYADAKRTWRRVRDQHRKDEESYWFKKANQEMRASDLATEWEKQTPNFQLEALPESVNSEMSEFGGTFLTDGRLVFASLRGNFDAEGRLQDDPLEYKVKVYEADSTMAAVMPRPMWNDGQRPEANFAWSEASELVAFVQINGEGQNEIILGEGNPDAPSFQKILPAPGDSAYYSHPAFGVIDGQEVLFFSSDRPGGYGKSDIWYMPLHLGDASPINAGPNVNTPGDEVTPFYRLDENRLYFASDWHHGLGGFDIFRSDYDGTGFAFPENLKQPFNTPANDLYYTFNSLLGKGTVSSNRPSAIHPENEGCCNDLWLFTEVKIAAADTLPAIATLEDLNKYLPVKLYFHNDEPDPRTTAEETMKNYLETYRNYTALIPTYEQEYNKGLADDKGEEAEEAMARFFISEVDRGVQDLELFTRLLRTELEKGQRVEVTVKGFASPLAKSDYNVKLTSRRISSLENYLMAYDRGALKPYLLGSAENGGRLDIIRIPFGEYVADTFVSDNPNDKNNAIYSIAAARERKIEIVSVQRPQMDTLLANISVESEIINLGMIDGAAPVPFSFRGSIESIAPLRIDSLVYDTSLLTIPVYTDVIAPGQAFELAGTLHPKGDPGKQYLEIDLWGNLDSGRKTLIITFETE